LSLRTWKTGNSGFFSTIINGTGQLVKNIKLQPLEGTPSPHQLTGDQAAVRNRMTQMNPGAFNQKLVRSKLGFVLPKEKEVDLIRENGSNDRHKAV